MGSSNLNDRSQCGDRDSEIALVVEDKEMVPSKVNGQDVSEVFLKSGWCVQALTHSFFVV
jgi:phosphatidylserine/phosphatidylglycerophosphate/cardiolipin synthase-like enzyme